MKGVKCIKRLFYLVLFICAFVFISPSKNANAWELTDPFFSSSNELDYYLSYMTQADGAPYIQNDVFWDNVTPSTYILTATDSAIQTKTLFGYRILGYQFSGDDKTKTYHSAQAIFYFTAYNSSYKHFGNVPIHADYIITNDSSDWLRQTVQCTLSYSQNVSPPYEIAVSIECPQATLKRVGYHYVYVDLFVGDISDNDVNSPYFLQYRDGGGFKPSATIGQYIVSSTDNASELALEQITEQNQTIINQNETIINNQNQINDYLTDDTPPSANTSVISGSAGWLPAGPVDSLLTLPITLAQGILDVFTGTHECSAISLPLSLGPYSFNLDIPCLDSYFSLASVNIIWNAVGVIISAFVIYSTLKWLYTFVDETLSFRENNSGLWGGL